MLDIKRLSVLAVAICFPFAAAAEMEPAKVDATATNPLWTALTSGTPTLDVRYRYESVDQVGLAHDANAHTVRTRLGYKTGNYHDFSIGVEAENILALTDEYNDTINGKTTYPIVADPRTTIVFNQAYLSWQGLPKTTLTGGRQVINLDNQRWVGSVAWRQNDQTFDAVSAKTTPFEKLDLFYTYAFHVNRVFGPRTSPGTWDTAIHLINASYAGLPWLKLTGYTYLANIDESQTSSTATYGLRGEGKADLGSAFSALYAAEFAHQTDYGNNSVNYGLNYYLVEPGLGWKTVAAKIGYEVLEGNRVRAVQAPLGTLHAFNGWADKFLTTPVNGLSDFYINGSYKVAGVNEYFDGTTFQVAWHDYNSDRGNTYYGNEWNAHIFQTFFQHYTIGVKFADYNANGLFTDTRKIMTYLQVKY